MLFFTIFASWKNNKQFAGVVKKQFILLFVLMLGCTGVFAQDSLKTKTLDSVLVVSKQEDVQQRTSVSKLTAKDIQSINVLSVGEAVKFLGGTMVKDYGGLGGVKTVSVRGLSANHTAILYDGVNLFDNQSGQVDLSKYSISSVSNILMANGNFTPTLPTATSLASASSLSIETRKPSLGMSSTKGTFSMSYGSFNTANSNLFLAHRFSSKDILSTYLDMSNSDGRYPYVLKYGSGQNFQTEELMRENNDLFSTHAELNWFHDFNKNNTLKLKAYYYYSNRGLPASVTLYYQNSKQRLYNENAFLQATYTSYISDKLTYKNNAKFDWNYTEYLDPHYFNGMGGVDDRYTQRLLYDNNALSFQPKENLFFTLTNDIYHTSLYAPTTIDAEPERLASLTALVMDWNIAKYFYISANALHSFYLDQYIGGDRSKNHFSPFVSLFYKRGNYTASLFFKDIFRMPTFNEMYYRQMGDRNLKPEKTKQISLTNTYEFSYRDFFFSTELSLYHNDVKDKIVAIPRNVFLWSMLNYGMVEIYGMDLKCGVKADFQPFVLSLKLNYSYQHAEDVEESSLTYGQLLPYMPENLVSAIFSMDYKNFNFGFTGMFVDKRYSLQENTEQNILKAYADCGANISYYQMFKKINYKFTLDVKNIFDVQYEVVRAYPMMGRNFSLKAEINF